MKVKHIAMLFALFFVATLLSCSDDDGLSIDGHKVIDFVSEFGMISTNSRAQVVGFTNDNDEYRAFFEPTDITNAVIDTTYRALVYYYTSEDFSDYGLYAFVSIPVCPPIDISEVEEVKTDPVWSPEIWVSNNKSYINIGMTVYSYTDSSAHILDIVKSVDESKGNMTTLTLYHDQNDIPEYYSSTIYVSIPIKGYFESGEPVNIVINTYDSGVKEEIITIP